MILKFWTLKKHKLRILHVCGGDPRMRSSRLPRGQYSPRVWRWSYVYVSSKAPNTVFSTCVEVILKGKHKVTVTASILHVCGGDPQHQVRHQRQLRYSPRVWRWSPVKKLKLLCAWVFSTCVEVIPWLLSKTVFKGGILHVCGGDPYSLIVVRINLFVFSTCVEVILKANRFAINEAGILHVCGGDP